MPSKPSLVFVPSAWHAANTWDGVTSLLTEQGYNCTSVTLPSTLGDPSATFLQDLTTVRDAITAQTKEGRDVVVVVHSYSGSVGASAIKGLTKTKDATEPSSEGHVVGMAMIAAEFAVPGKSFIDSFGEKAPPTWKEDGESGFATIAVDARDLLYHDLPAVEGKMWASELQRQSLKALKEGGEHVYAGWADVPNWFLLTLDDHAHPAEAQRTMAHSAKEAGGDVTIREIHSGHSPMLSRPKDVVDFLLEAVAAFSKYE